jgi:2',3'-cyclic-nucleotide 2'-phosphodiesterase/3'-nucleotidase/5'-nucleotidase
VVNTDGNYKYLGRLVLDFDAAGVIIPGSYDATVSGAYRTDAAGLAALDADAFIDARVQGVVDSLRSVIVAQESEWFGVSDVFLNGNRNPGVRSEETNLGNLTADANLAYARAIDPTVMVSLKNGGGIRNAIGQSVVPTGSVDGKPELLPTAAVFDAQGNVVKPEGGISRNDIANALSFNNGLSLVSVSPSELKALIEHGIAAGVNQGRFPQVGGMAFSYDLSRPAGSRVLNLTIEDQAGNDLDVLVLGGAVVGDPTRSIRMVTLNFLASGGDGYPFTNLTSPNRLDLTASDTAPRTGVATFAADGSEQDALAEFLADNHSPANPFTAADTPAALDTRLQNLALRSDTVIDPGTVTINGLSLITNLPAGYQLRRGTGSPIQITFSGLIASQENPGSGWSAIGAVASGSGYQLYWSNALTNQYSRWLLNASGALTTASIISLAEMQATESSVNFDLNTDGIIGYPLTTLENQGAIRLLRRADGKAFVEDGSANRREVTSPWGTGVGNESSTWQMLAAESIEGVNTILWRNNDSNFLHTWSLNANWGWQSSQGIVNPNTPAGWDLESTFKVDANRDGITGTPFTTLESQGATKLLRRGDGKAFVEDGSANRREVTSPWGTGVGNESSTWQMLAAESIEGVNTILWRNNDSNFLHTWSLNSNWGWQSSQGIVNPSGPAGWELERTFQVDANRDGAIGFPMSI